MQRLSISLSLALLFALHYAAGAFVTNKLVTFAATNTNNAQAFSFNADTTCRLWGCSSNPTDCVYVKVAGNTLSTFHNDSSCTEAAWNCTLPDYAPPAFASCPGGFRHYDPSIAASNPQAFFARADYDTVVQFANASETCDDAAALSSYVACGLDYSSFVRLSTELQYSLNVDGQTTPSVFYAWLTEDQWDSCRNDCPSASYRFDTPAPTQAPTQAPTDGAGSPTEAPQTPTGSPTAAPAMPSQPTAQATPTLAPNAPSTLAPAATSGVSGFAFATMANLAAIVIFIYFAQ